MSSERKLHPAAVLLSALGAFGELAVPLLIGVVLGGTRDPLTAVALGLLGVGVALAMGIVRWNATTYRVTDRSLHFRSGVFSPDDVVVPLDRIHAVDAVQGPVQRLFGAVALHVQTPGGGGNAEIVLAALAPGDARALRAELGHPESGGAEVVRRLGLRMLVATALTAPQLGVLLPLLGAVAAVGDDLLPAVEDDVLRTLDRPADWLLAATALLAAAWLLSFAGAIVAFAGFELERDGDRLRVRRGVLQRRAASVPVARVDGVRLVEGVLRRPFGLVTVRLEVAGLRGEQAAARTLFPLLRRREAVAFLERFLPELAGALEPAQRPPARAWRAYLGPPAALAAVAGGVLVAVAPAAWPAAVAALALAVALGVADARAAGTRLDDGLVLLRGRDRLARVTLLARRHRLQDQQLSQHPLQRRAGTATVALAVGSGARLAVRHLEQRDAQALFDRLP